MGFPTRDVRHVQEKYNQTFSKIKKVNQISKVELHLFILLSHSLPDWHTFWFTPINSLASATFIKVLIAAVFQQRQKMEGWARNENASL